MSTVVPNPHARECLAMFERICEKHKYEILRASIDWGVTELSVPGYDGKVEQCNPYVLVDFKY